MNRNGPITTDYIVIGARTLVEQAFERGWASCAEAYGLEFEVERMRAAARIEGEAVEYLLRRPDAELGAEGSGQ